MNAPIELHGVRLCPFAFRTRLGALEKGVAFEWLPFDAPSPDPRAAAHNPTRRSPLLWQDGFTVTDSLVILSYLDEAFDGPPLLPADPRHRAHLRVTMLELAPIHIDGRVDLTPETRATALGGLKVLEGKLADGDPWLGGATPSVADVELWPFLVILATKGGLGPDVLAGLPQVAAYWARVRTRPSLVAQNPYGPLPA